jgi:amino acid transporter
LEFGFKTGGPVVLLYGWLIVGVFSIIVASVMAEICSTYPVAGSVYYWSGVLARPEKQPIFSFVTGWVYFQAYLGMLTSFSYGLAGLIFGLFESSVTDLKSSNTISPWHASES